MDFLRRHLFFILCGLAAAGGIALGVTGLQGMPKVRDEMHKVENLYNSLDGLQSKPVNRQRIKEERQRIKRLRDDHTKVFERARALYGYKLLVDNAFPDGDSLALIEFRRRYVVAMHELLKLLHSGGPASDRDIAHARDLIADEEAASQDHPDAATAFGPERTPAGVLTKVGARKNPVARANLIAAQRIYCYAIAPEQEKTQTKASSLNFSEAMKDTGSVDAPDIEEAWFAQVGYWIQSDVVRAIAAINDEAVQQLHDRGDTPWVGNLPVKDVISIRLSDGYIPQDGEEVSGAVAGGYDAAYPPGTPETVFTHSGASPWYDVMQFSVKLVMDERYIPRLVQRLSQQSAHTLLRVSYAQVPPNKKLVGKIYGSDPVVNVVMDFETIMLGEKFRPLMPQAVCDAYDINCPPREPKDNGD